MQALSAEGVAAMQHRRNDTNGLRMTTEQALATLSCVDEVFDSRTNFLLASFHRADVVMRTLLDRGIVLRDQTYHRLLPRHLRLTIGDPHEMQQLLDVLRRLN